MERSRTSTAASTVDDDSSGLQSRLASSEGTLQDINKDGRHKQNAAGPHQSIQQTLFVVREINDRSVRV